MSGGVNQDMGIGVLALRNTHFVEMVYTTRYILGFSMHLLRNLNVFNFFGDA